MIHIAVVTWYQWDNGKSVKHVELFEDDARTLAIAKAEVFRLKRKIPRGVSKTDYLGVRDVTSSNH